MSTVRVLVVKDDDPPLQGGMLMGAANGAPGPLDGSGKLPSSQVPAVGGSDPTALHAGNNLSDVGNASTARTNLGLGSAATHPAGDFDTSGAAMAAQSAAITAAHTDAASQVSALSASLPSVYAPIVAALLDVVTTSTDGALTIGRNNEVDASGANRAMTLADPSSAGQVVTFSKSDTTTNTVTLTAKIRGSAGATITLSLPHESITLVSKSTGWYPVGDHKTLNSLDNRYFQVTEAPLDPARYGAVGTGDDSATLQAAVNAAARAANGELRLYRAHTIASNLTVPGPLKIGGAAGYETVLTQVTAAKAAFTLLKDTSGGETFNRGLTLENLRIVGPGNGTSTAAGIDGNNSGDNLYQGQHLLLDNVTLHGWDICVRLHHWDNCEVRASIVEYSRVGWWSDGNNNSMRLQSAASNCTEVAFRIGDGGNVQLDLLDVISCGQMLDLLDQSDVNLRGGNFESCTGSQAFVHVANGARLTAAGAALRFLKNVGSDVPGFLVENGGLLVIDGAPAWSGFAASQAVKKASDSATVHAVGPSRSLSVAPELLVDDNSLMTYPPSPWPVRQDNAVPAAGVNLRNMLLAALTRDAVATTDKLYYYGKDRSSGSDVYVRHVLTGRIEGTGSPETVVVAPIGTLYVRTDAPDISHAFYFKLTGTGNTGWSAIAGTAGPTGPAGPASRKDVSVTAQGLGSENFARQLMTGTTAPTAGVAYGMLLGAQAGDVVTNLCVFVGTAGTGAAPTLIRLGLVDSAGVVQAVTANDVASSRWTTGFTVAQVPLTAPYTIPAAGGYRVVFLQTGAWGTVQMTLGRAATLLANSQSAPIGSGIREVGTYGALSDLPAVSASLAAGSNTNLPFWVGVN